MANASALNWKSVQSSLKFQSFFPPLSEEIRRESFSSHVPDQAYMWNVCIFYTSHNENIYLKSRTQRRGSDELHFLRCCMTCFPTALLRLNMRAAGHIYTNQKNTNIWCLAAQVQNFTITSDIQLYPSGSIISTERWPCRTSRVSLRGSSSLDVHRVKNCATGCCSSRPCKNARS